MTCVTSLPIMTFCIEITHTHTHLHLSSPARPGPAASPPLLLLLPLLLLHPLAPCSSTAFPSLSSLAPQTAPTHNIATVKVISITHTPVYTVCTCTCMHYVHTGLIVSIIIALPLVAAQGWRGCRACPLLLHLEASSFSCSASCPSVPPRASHRIPLPAHTHSQQGYTALVVYRLLHSPPLINMYIQYYYNTMSCTMTILNVLLVYASYSVSFKFQFTLFIIIYWRPGTSNASRVSERLD